MLLKFYYYRSKDSRRLFRGTSKVSKILRAPAKELEWDSDQVIDAVVKVIFSKYPHFILRSIELRYTFYIVAVFSNHHYQAGAVPLLASFLTHIEDQKLQVSAHI